MGEHVLTGAYIERGAEFPDAVVNGAWPQEYHVAGRSTEYRFQPVGRRYQIPYSSLRSREVENLLVAGRCISADHDALASTRVMGPSLALGEAAGTAAALAARDARPVGEIDVAELGPARRRQGADVTALRVAPVSTLRARSLRDSGREPGLGAASPSRRTPARSPSWKRTGASPTWLEALAAEAAVASPPVLAPAIGWRSPAATTSASSAYLGALWAGAVAVR